MGLFSVLRRLMGVTPQRAPARPVAAKPAREYGRTIPKREPPAQREWYGPGRNITIQLPGNREVVAHDPLVYIAKGTREVEPSIPCTILMRLPVGRPQPEEPSGYWPSYQHITPAARGALLQWIAGPKDDPTFPIGLVFIYFYGLEWRILNDRQDAAAIITELRKLVAVYGSNRSFYNYSGNLAMMAHILDPSVDLEPTFLAWMRHPHRPFKMPRALVDGTLARCRTKVPARLAIEGLKHCDEIRSTKVIKQAEEEFHTLFKQAYVEANLSDFLTRTRAKMNPKTVVYTWAAACAHDHTEDFRSSQPIAYATAWRPVIAVWKEVESTLRKMVRLQSDASVTSAEQFDAIPEALRRAEDHPEYDKWHTWLETSQNTPRGYVTTYQEVLEVADGIEPVNNRVTKAVGRQLAERLAGVGLAIEPDPRAKAGTREITEQCLIYEPEGPAVPPSETYASAALIIELCHAVAASDGSVDDSEIDHILSHIDVHDEIPETDRERLHVLVVYLNVVGADLRPATKAKLSKLSSQSREVLANLTVSIALADGTVTANEAKALKKIYRALDIDQKRLAAVLTVDPSTQSEATTSDEDSKPERMAINWAAVSELRAETDEVQDLLAAALAESEQQERDSSEEPDEQPEPSAAHEGTHDADEPTSSPETASAWGDLDTRAAQILDQLKGSDAVTSTELTQLCQACGLLPNAAVEIINDWSDTVLGDFLIEGDGPYTLNWDLCEERT